MESIIKLPASAISIIFSQISDIPTKVSWIRSPDYKQQLYVNAAYENVWGFRPERLYEHPASWNDTVTNSDVIDLLINRKPDSNTSQYFNIIDHQGKIKFIKDTCFHLFDQDGSIIAVAGISEELAVAQWEHEIITKKLNKNELDIVSEILRKETKKNHTNPMRDEKNNPSIKFTRREKECLESLSSGKSAKQIARDLSISPRTVEAHIDNMKFKLGCRTRIELLSRLNFNVD